MGHRRCRAWLPESQRTTAAAVGPAAWGRPNRNGPPPIGYSLLAVPYWLFLFASPCCLLVGYFCFVLPCSEALDMLKKLGCEEELQKVADSKKVRSGKGKMRNRRYTVAIAIAIGRAI